MKLSPLASECEMKSRGRRDPMGGEGVLYVMGFSGSVSGGGGVSTVVGWLSEEPRYQKRRCRHGQRLSLSRSHLALTEDPRTVTDARTKEKKELSEWTRTPRF